MGNYQRRIATLLAVAIATAAASAGAQTCTDSLSALVPAQRAQVCGRFGDGSVYVPIGDPLEIKFGSTARWKLKYEESSVANMEMYAGTSDGADSQYLYVQGGGGPVEIDGDRGAILELAGNEVTPTTSRGRAQLFSGNVAGGHIGLNVMNGSDGKVLVQSASTNKFSFQPSDNTALIYANTSINSDSGTKTFSLLSGIYADAGAAKLELPNGTTIPATCTVGEVFADTNSNDCADSGGGDGALCICKSANTWALVANF